MLNKTNIALISKANGITFLDGINNYVEDKTKQVTFFLALILKNKPDQIVVKRITTSSIFIREQPYTCLIKR